MFRRPTNSTRTYTLFPSPTLFRSTDDDHNLSLGRRISVAVGECGDGAGDRFLEFLADLARDRRVAVTEAFTQCRERRGEAGATFVEDERGAHRSDLGNRKSTRLTSSH